MSVLSVHNPEQIRVVDRVDERATLILARAEVMRSSHAGQIFTWLFAQTGGKAGVVRDVTLSQLVAAVDCSDRGARKWLELLERRGLIQVPPIGSPERPKRLDPYVIYVLQTAPQVAQKTFDFMPEPVVAEPVVRLVNRDGEATKRDCTLPESHAASGVKSRGPTVRTNGTDQRYGPTVPSHNVCQKAPPPNNVNEPEVVAAAVVGDSSDAGTADDELPLAQQLLRMRAGALKPQTHSNSSLLQAQTPQTKPLSQETRAWGDSPRPSGERRGGVAEPIGGALAGVLGGVLHAFEQRLEDPGAIARQVQALVTVVNEILPQAKHPTLSRNYVQRAAEVAVMGTARVDHWRPIGPSDVERWARRAAEGDEPAACFHAKVNKEFKRRLIECPKLETKGPE